MFSSKKVFYALRPAATLRWLRLRPEEAIAPMHFPTLIAESDLPSDVTVIVSDLLDRKSKSRELGIASVPEPIRAFIDNEFDQARRLFEGGHVRAPPDAFAAADELFRRHAYYWSV